MFINDIFKKKQLNEGGFDIPEIPRAPQPKPVPTKDKTVDEAGPFSYGAKKPRKGSVADLAAQKRKEQEKGKQPIEPKDQQVGTAKVVKEFAPSGGGGGRWYSDDQLYEIIGEDWLEAFDVSGDQGNIDLNGERARLFLAQEAEAWLTDRGYRVNVLDVKDDGDSLSWYIQGPLYRGLAEGTQVFKLNDYDQWSDKVDAQGAVKHVQKNRTFVVAQSWDGEKIGEFDTRSNQGWVMTQGVAEGSAQDKLHKRHQELRKKSGLPDPNYYKELKASYDLPDQERYAKQKEIKQKYKVTNEDREQYIEELGRAGYEIITEKRMTCPECGGAAYEDKMLAEKQDACYHKVKSRYKVWPSAYASGALVRCRKKGAKNWGNKSK